MIHRFLPRDSSKIFALSSLFSFLIAIGFFVSLYVVYEHNGLPMGWDTPLYIGQMLSITNKGALSFIQGNGYYNIGYSLISSFFVVLGFSPFIVEIFFPIALCASLILILGIIALKFLKNAKIASLVMFLATGWFAIYGLGAGLNSNLLSLVILLSSSYFFLSGFDLEKRRIRWLWFFPLLALASFTHIETAFFFSAIFTFTAIQLYRSTPNIHLRRRVSVYVLLIITVMIPSTLLYIRHLNTLISQTNGILVAYSPLQIGVWIAYLGILFPIAFAGFLLTLRSPQQWSCSLKVFVTIWAFFSIILALAEYVVPIFQTFSERALMLFPVPFVAGLGFWELLSRIHHWTNHLTRLLNRVIIVGLALVIVSSSLFYTYAQVAPEYRVWITPSAYDRLKWLSNNYELSSPPIFVYDDIDQYAGGLGDLYNNWVQAIYGNHYSYLGDVNFLLALSETPFTSPPSKAFSSIFLEQMKNDGVLSDSGLLQHQIILVEDLYAARPLPLFDRGFFDEIHDGIFVFNSSKLNPTPNIYVPFYAIMSSKMSTNGWYQIQRDWTSSVNALEFWKETSSNESYAEFLFPSANPGNYSFTVRYWDGDTRASGIVLTLNDRFLGKITYDGTMLPANFTAYANVGEGISTLRIDLPFILNLPQYASLDYLEISFHGE